MAGAKNALVIFFIHSEGGAKMGKCQFSEMTKEELQEAGRKGGIASGIAKRKKKAMKETLEILLSLKLKKGDQFDIEDVDCIYDLKGQNIDVETAILLKQIERALQGDLAATTFLRDTSGQAAASKVEVSGEVNNPFKDLTTEELRELISDE